MQATHCDYGRAVFLLELPEFAAVYYTGDDIAHVERLAQVSANNTMELRGGIQWVFRGRWRLPEASALHMQLLEHGHIDLLGPPGHPQHRDHR